MSESKMHKSNVVKAVVNMSGGIGNQLFQYSFGQYLAVHQRNIEVLYDLRDLVDRNASHIGSNLQDLGLSINAFYFRDNYYQYLLTCTKRQRTLLREQRLRSKDVGMECECDKAHQQSLYCMGYWQDQKYTNSIKSHLENKFDDYFKRKFISSEYDYSGIAVHIRRGDYLKPVNLEIYHQYKMEVYRKFIMQHCSNRKIYIFSDDIFVVKKELEDLSPYVTFVEDPALSALDELVLMAKFGAILTGNSTFSWWAAYLYSDTKQIYQLPYWFKNQHTPAGLLL